MELNLSTPVLHVEQLDFHFATHSVFQRFSRQFGPGITWLRGANGAGKTTLLKLAGGALQPARGTIRLDDIDSSRQPLAYRAQAFYCGGDTPALPWLQVHEFLDLHLALYPGSDKGLLNDELSAFAMTSTLQQSITALSLGQHKKLQLALALALPVRLLLIDEPFNGLDASAMAYLRQRLSEPQRLARQCIVLTSHVEPQVPLAATLELSLLYPGFAVQP
ncbi:MULTISPECIES: ATP-binding cassette domain-containing protein [unclassified Janthinobacterium]|uniref:ABC transporter ATP-binding protein n=1 Tax=unclassified Janthinobacterium TaxID=2610881 RepID=UPI00161FFF0D|nr:MULTISPECIES: ATP-binding cassette domain-containing protein [unclassified Janthinobacterium]MBB5608165.1 ABC-type multidrug transport system ATPase subunit [Janthinobacterium sp. S3T4]MBB5613491.1 ABC-type multidrug transport system ATPase subunit [Janthinobacterium sp. S3M3]